MKNSNETQQLKTTVKHNNGKQRKAPMKCYNETQ